MKTVLYIILPMILPMIAAVLWRIPQAKDKYEWLCGSILIADLNLLFGSFCIYFIWEANPIYCLIHSFIVYYHALSIQPVWRIKGINEIGKYNLIIETGLILIISTIFSLYFYVSPYFYRLMELRQGEVKYHVTHIQKSMDEIRSSIRTTQSTLEESSKVILKSLDDLNQIVIEKSKEVNDRETKFKALETEIGYLKNLSSLTEPQTASVVNALSRNKWLDNIIGFAIGILSSAAFSLIATMAKKIRIKKDNKQSSEA